MKRVEFHGDFPLKPCAFCGSTMKRKRYGTWMESVAQYSKRKTCNRCCAVRLRRGCVPTASDRRAAATDVAPDQRVTLAFAGRLAALRINTGLSQKELCLLIGIGEKLYSSWECGARTEVMVLRNLVRIATFYRLTVGELLGDIGIVEDNTTSPLLENVTPSVVGDHPNCFPGSPRMCAECRPMWNLSLREAV